MKLSRIGRVSMALVVSVAMALGMTACGGGTIGYIWVLGTQKNEIVGFKVDDYTGNLTQALHSPFSANGTNPVSIVVRAGGRYVYVINKGIAASGNNAGTPGNIAVFSVGSGGILTFQTQYTSRGSNPLWAQIDPSGNYLYVLDSLYPDTPAYPNPNGYGDITVFAIDPNTGRLQLVPNQQIKDSNQTQLTFFPVGPKPIMSKLSGGCLYTINGGDQTIFPYSVGSSGQLTLTANSTIQTNAGNLTSINGNGTYIWLTDAAPTADSPGGRILPYTTGTSGACTLNTLTGGPVNNLPLTSNPVYSFSESKGLRLYVLNRSSTNSENPNTSSISAFNIETNGRLTPLPSANNPYAIGAGPSCMVEDPTNQYVYTSNNIDGSVTGKQINTSTGELNDLQRGSTFPATGQATCLAVSPNVD